MYIHDRDLFYFYYTYGINMYRLNIEDLKNEYVGKTINWLTIIDVYRDDSGKVMFKCQCRCGNIKSFSKKSLTSNKSRISCGCYKNSKEKSDQKLQYYKDHPELREYLSNKRKKLYEEHPEIAVQIGNKNRQLYIDDPDRRNAVGKRISDWFKNNPDKIPEWAEHRRNYYKEHPEIGEARSKLYSEHPEICEKISKSNKRFNEEHPDKVKRINNINKSISLEKRRSSNYDKLIEVIKPDYIDDLLNGNIKAYDVIETKCPVCGEYAHHSMNDVYTLSKRDFKFGKAPLCRSCHINLTSCFTSKYEQEIADYIATFYSGTCLHNDRAILNGKELDLYYPDKCIAIEFNGDYWHNSDHKPENYHYEKFKLCLSKNILLISIFESEWLNRKDLIFEYIKDLFNGNKNSLTFEKEGYMNNDYPFFDCCIDLNNVVENTYSFNDSVVKTCGYSLLVK